MTIFLTFTPDYHISPFSVTDGFLCCFYVTILKDFYHLTQLKKNTLYNFTHKQQMLYLIRALTQIPDILTIIKYIGIMYQKLIKN